MKARRQIRRITLTARVFVLLAVLVSALDVRTSDAFTATAAVCAVYALAALIALQDRYGARAAIVEAAALGCICGFSLLTFEEALICLVIPPFVAAVRVNLWTSLLTLCGELASLVAVTLLWHADLPVAQAAGALTWTVAGGGLALVGNFIRATTDATRDELAPYLDAQRLIRELLDLSGELSDGLDVSTLAGSVIEQVADHLPASAIAVYRPVGEALIPLGTSSTLDQPMPPSYEELALESWAHSQPLVHEGGFAFPLGDSTIVAGQLASAVDLARTEVERRILEFSETLRPSAVQLDTAILFATFRDAASADERKRLAREMHDGVAQDIASLGYLVDALAARPASEQQAAQFTKLRERVTAIVAEVRQSVLTLRTSIGESESLGAAISTLARHLSESSQVPISVTLDEHPSRLRPAVEAELFRIAQEAMNNALKHARCSRIDVDCQVHAPRARITITDDGVGLQQGRSDSHGLKIMRERARLARAELTVGPAPAGGTRVEVVIP